MTGEQVEARIAEIKKLAISAKARYERAQAEFNRASEEYNALLKEARELSLAQAKVRKVPTGASGRAKVARKKLLEQLSTAELLELLQKIERSGDGT